MSPAGHKTLYVGLLCAAQLWLVATPAQAATNEPAMTRSNSATARRAAPPLPPSPDLLPPPPSVKSPIAFFRELLAMNPAERKQALTNRPPDSQARILAKVHEYLLLKPNDCELRLQVTELQWYLLPLMTAPATNRPALLAAIPLRQRKLVEDRLREWDKLTPPVQKQLLDNQIVLRYMAEIEGLTDERRREILKTISPERRAMLEEGIARWDTMSAEQRRNTLGHFYRFFELTSEEKEKALNTLSGPERRQIEKTLITFGNLPPAQRTACIQSFAKFASLSLEERHQFLKNAERWKAMPPAERKAWRDLVRNIPPPLPPDLPPLPPSTPRPRPAHTVATNGG